MAKSTLGVDDYLSTLDRAARDDLLERLRDPDLSHPSFVQEIGLSESTIRKYRRTQLGWEPSTPASRNKVTRESSLEDLNYEKEKEIKRLRRSEAKAWAEVERLEDAYGLAFALKEGDSRVPAWVKQRPKRSTTHAATPVLVLSDQHHDEVVDPREVMNLNAYDREISLRRFQRVIDMAPEWCKTYTSGMSFDGIVCVLGGDTFTGEIHDELVMSNEAHITQSVSYWVKQYAAGLKHLADEFGQVYAPAVNGNHGRLDKKMHSKGRHYRSWEFLFYDWLNDLVADDDRITLGRSQADQIRFEVFDTSFLLHHGNISRSSGAGSGWGGVVVPIGKWASKASDLYAAQRKPIDYFVMGHWHQLVYYRNLIINGSLKGYDEYARDQGYPPEDPQQALFLVTPERGITMRTSIFADPARGDWG